MPSHRVKKTAKKASVAGKKSSTSLPSAKGDLPFVFETIRTLLKKYESSLVTRINTDARYDLWSEKDIVFAGRPRKEMFFAGLIIQRNYVGFYFMPVYSDPDKMNFFKPELRSRLKGKSCFHIKSTDPAILQQIKEALEKGFLLYKEKGWI